MAHIGEWALDPQFRRKRIGICGILATRRHELARFRVVPQFLQAYQSIVVDAERGG